MEQRICGYRRCGQPLRGQQRRWCREAHRVAELRSKEVDAIPLRPCKTCGQPMPVRSGSGRPRIYCSSACKPAPIKRRSPVRQRICGNATCGVVSFTTSQPRQRYCSRACRDEASRRRNSIEVECAACGLPFRKRRDDLQRWSVHCCSNECKAFAKRTQLFCPLRWVSCPKCRLTWHASNGRRDLCEQCHPPVVRRGPACRLPRRPVQSRHFVSCACEHCGTRFLDWANLHPAIYHRCPACRPKRWKSDKARAERHGVAYEPIDRRRLYERDDYRCGICGEQTDPTADPSTPRYPTLDHIVPMANGGPHLWANVQCACFECNWRKADGTDAKPKHPKHHQGWGGGVRSRAQGAPTLRPGRISLPTQNSCKDSLSAA